MNLLIYGDISGLLLESLSQPAPQEMMIGLKKYVHMIKI